jgi:multidrug efflux system outer membrane protein
MKILALLLASSSLAFAGLPTVGPDYQRPPTSAPAAYRDAGDDAASASAWKSAAPADALPRGEWWKLFADPALDDLESRALVANQDLRAAAARVEQARAAAGLARSAYWPQVAVDGTVMREQNSTTTGNVFPEPLTTTYRLPLEATWELDLFGRVRRLSESARADAAASAATFESVRLALTADVATNYFSLTALDRELAVVRDTTALRHRALELVQTRVKSGIATDFDAARAETELASSESEAAALANRRAALQNALAVLVGESAPAFSLSTRNSQLSTIPAIPAGLPSELLERRPDIAAAERSLAAANARIGVAKSAFFPAISLTGSAGFASGDIDRLTQSDSRLWSIGPRLYLPIFQGGRNRANLARSEAAFDEGVAVFRQRVLVALREVQDALTATRLLAEQSAAQDRAVASARRATSLAQRRYDSGFVAYLEVIDAQRTGLAVERASAQLAAQRLNTSVALIKALGGGWKNPAAALVAAR